MTDIMQAQESDLGRGITTFDETTLLNSISGIIEAGETYRTAYNSLVNYFANDVQKDVQGEVLNAFRDSFEGKRAELKAVNDFIDSIVSDLQTKTNTGTGVVEDLLPKI